MTNSKLNQSLTIARLLGQPKKYYVWEQSVYLEFDNNIRVSVYFDTLDNIIEIHTVDCDIQHTKVTHRYFSVK